VATPSFPDTLHLTLSYFFTAVCTLILSSLLVSAQEMEPRAYSRSPVGTQFVVFSYGYHSGDVLTDAAIPLDDVNVKLHTGSLGYGRTVGLAKRQANALILATYVKGSASGTVFENLQEVTRSGMGDVRAKFSINLIGGPALTRKEFATYKPRALLGASVTVVAPTGQYDPRRLINIGSNRWAFKPEAGLSKPFGKWTVEMVGGVWLFTTNKEFFGGVERGQKPLLSLQSHVIYTVKPRMWLAFNATYYAGGRTIINDVVNSDKQSNSRLGATYSLPITRSQSFKVAFAKGVTARFGGKLTTIAAAWQYVW